MAMSRIGVLLITLFYIIMLSECMRTGSRQVPIVDSSTVSTLEATEEPFIINSLPSDNMTANVSSTGRVDNTGSFVNPIYVETQYLPNPGTEITIPIGTPNDEDQCMASILDCDDNLSDDFALMWGTYFM